VCRLGSMRQPCMPSADGFLKTLSKKAINAMSREIVPISSTATGGEFTLPFPDLAKPKDGPWELSVTLKKTTAAPSDALIELIQNDRTLGSTTVSLTNSPVTYAVPITADGNAMAAVGRCQLTGLTLHVKERACDCSDNCCEGIELPGVLHFEIVSSCPSQNASGYLLQTSSGVWDGGYVRLYCDNGCWLLDAASSDFFGYTGVCPDELNCDPLELVWNLTINHPNPPSWSGCKPGDSLIIRITL